MQVGLAKTIPEEIYKNIPTFSDILLDYQAPEQEQDDDEAKDKNSSSSEKEKEKDEKEKEPTPITREECTWAIHPGGELCIVCLYCLQ